MAGAVAAHDPSRTKRDSSALARTALSAILISEAIYVQADIDRFATFELIRVAAGVLIFVVEHAFGYTTI